MVVCHCASALRPAALHQNGWMASCHVPHLSDTIWRTIQRFSLHLVSPCPSCAIDPLTASLNCPSTSMAPCSRLLHLLLLLCWTSAGLACFCERYPWGSWSACSSTCNHGVKHRRRYVKSQRVGLGISQLGASTYQLCILNKQTLVQNQEEAAAQSVAK